MLVIKWTQGEAANRLKVRKREEQSDVGIITQIIQIQTTTAIPLILVKTIQV